MGALWLWLWELTVGNPMAVRIVQGGSRRVRHLWVRMGYLGVLIFLVTIGLLSSNAIAVETTLTDLAIAGSKTFNAISRGQVILICLLAPLFMAGAIAQEHAGRTYDILLTTPMSNLQIVIGSLIGRLFFILTLIAGGLPIFAVLLVFGGVPIEAIFVSFAVAAMTAVTVGSAAVTLSVMRKGGRKAVFAFVIVVSSYLVIVYSADVLLLRHITTVPGSGSEGTTWVTPLHPLLVLEASFNVAGYRPPPADALADLPGLVRFYLSRPFGSFMAINGLTSCGLVLVSTVGLRSAGRQDRSARTRWFPMKQLWGRGGQAEQVKARVRKRVWHNPIAWREAAIGGHGLSRVIGRASFLLIGIAGPTVVLWLYHAGVLPRLPDPTTGIPLHPHEVVRLAIKMLVLLEIAVIVLIAIYMSAGCISREREDGTLDLLLTTPITPKMYIWGKLQGLVSFLGLLILVPVLTLAIPSGYACLGRWFGWPGAMIPYTSISSSGSRVTDPIPLLLVESPVLMLIIFLPFVALCVAIGINWSIRTKSVLGAIVSTLTVVGGLSLVMGLCGPQAAENLPVVGAVLNALSPLTYTSMLVDPWGRLAQFPQNPSVGRLILWGASLGAGACYSVIMYLLTTSMVRTFDHTVRKISGTA